MSRPHEYPPGAYYTIERRVLRRWFRLLPNAALNRAMAVAMVAACKRTGVELIAWVVMSNHYHVLVRDPEGRVAEWMRDVHALVARFLNAQHGVEPGTPLWDVQGGNHTRLQGLDRVVERAVYILSNPVAALLVRTPWEWPGLVTPREHLARGTGPTYRRADTFFRVDGPVPAVGALVSHAPAGVDAEAFRARVFAGVREAVAAAQRKAQKSGRGFVGREGLRRLSTFGRPRAARGARAQGAVGRRPTLLGSSPEETQVMVARRIAFRERYAAALLELRRTASAVFPPGTFMLWRFFGAHRAPYEPAELGELTRT